jgi:hypothetical protein
MLLSISLYNFFNNAFGRKKKIMKTVFTASATNLAFSNSAVATLNGLRERRITWEATDYKKANEGLYALLADCLDLFNSKFVTATDDDRKTLRMDLEAKLKADGLKAQRNTTTLTMFVRYVFGNDRKRAHAYTYVIKAAISYDITAENLPTYITNEGGIEEIKRKMVVKEETLQKRAELAKAQEAVVADLEVAKIKPLATVKLGNIKGDYAVLVGKPNVNGDTDIIGVLGDVNEALYNALLKKLAKQHVEVVAEKAAMASEVNDLLDVPNNTLADQLAA